MDRKKIVIGLIIFVIMFCGFYVLQIISQNNKNNKSFSINIPGLKDYQKNIPGDKTSDSQDGITINELISQGKPVKCSNEGKNDAQAPQFIKTVYTAQEKVRLDLVIKKMPANETPPASSSILVANGYKYSWSLWANGKTKGYKVDVAGIAKKAPDLAKNTFGFGQDIKMKLNCAPWIIDETILNPPANIVFEDVTEQTIKMLQSPAPAPTPAKP
jgi:hypothetical protein